MGKITKELVVKDLLLDEEKFDDDGIATTAGMTERTDDYDETKN